MTGPFTRSSIEKGSPPAADLCQSAADPLTLFYVTPRRPVSFEQIAGARQGFAQFRSDRCRRAKNRAERAGSGQTARLEELRRGAAVKGISPDGPVTVVDATWHGSTVLEITYKDATGRLGNELLYREPELEIVAAGRPWGFDSDGALFWLVSEANRIRLAYLFDPLLAVHISRIDPLPHQITAVCGKC